MISLSEITDAWCVIKRELTPDGNKDHALSLVLSMYKVYTICMCAYVRVYLCVCVLYIRAFINAL